MLGEIKQAGYIKIQSKWLIDTAKYLLQIMNKEDLVRIESGKDGVKFGVRSLPHIYSRRKRIVAGAGEISVGGMSISTSHSFLTMASKLPAQKGYMVGIRSDGETVSLTMIRDKDGLSNLDYKFQCWRGFDGDLLLYKVALKAEMKSIVLPACVLVNMLGKVRRLREFKDLKCGFFVSLASNAIRTHSFTNHYAVKSEWYKRGDEFCNPLTRELTLESANDMSAAIDKLKVGEEVMVLLSDRCLELDTAEGINMQVGTKEETRSGGLIGKVFDNARERCKSEVIVNGESLKGAFERLDILARANPDNVHRVRVDLAINVSASPDNIMSLVITAEGYGVGNGREVVSVLRGSDTGGLPGFCVNAGRFADVLKSSDYANEMSIRWGDGNAVMFQWSEIVEGVENIVSVPAGRNSNKSQFRVYHEAVLSVMRS